MLGCDGGQENAASSGFLDASLYSRHLATCVFIPSIPMHETCNATGNTLIAYPHSASSGTTKVHGTPQIDSPSKGYSVVAGTAIDINADRLRPGAAERTKRNSL